MSDSINKNILSVYVSTLIPAGLTYLFWILASNYTNSKVIGVVAAISSFAMVLGVLSNFDVGIGMKRFLGKAVADNNMSQFKNIVSVATVFAISTSLGILIIALNPFFDVLGLVGIEKQFVPIVIAIVIGNDLQHIFIGALISALRSKSIVIPSILASLSRFPVLFLLFYLVKVSELSVAWSYSTSYVVICISLLVITLSFLGKIHGPFFYDVKNNLKLIIRGSLARWIPQIINVLGSQLSILAVFSLKGASESGLFYIPFAVFNVLFLVSGSINQVSHPVLSGIDEPERQKRFLRKALKLAFLGTMPVAGVMFFYAKPILSIFGSEFSVSNEILSILLFSFPIAIITEGVYFLLFARGNYKSVLLLGLTANIPRIILYFVLVPIYSGIGGAIAFVIGTILQMILTVILIERMGIRVQYGIFFILSIIPFALGFLFEFLGIGLIGSVMLFFFSFIIYLRLKIFDENDIENILETMMEPAKAIATKQRIVSELKRLHFM